MDWMDVLRNGLVFGGLTSLVMTGMILGSLRLNAEIWLGDAPPEIQAALPPISVKAKRQRAWFAYPTFAILIALVGLLIARLYQNTGAFPGFWAIAASVWVAFQVFNLIDLLLIDWLLIETIRPDFTVIPGAERFKDRRYYGYHLRAFLKGFFGITIFSLLIAGILSGVDWILRVF